MLRKCTSCNKIFAMKLIEKKLTQTEDIKVLEVLTEPNLKGEIQTKMERFVPGERKTYELTYQCRFCGEQHIRILHKIKKK